MTEGLTKNQRIDALINKVNSNLQSGLDDPVQEELANWMNLLPEINSSPIPHLIGEAEVAVSALLFEKPDLTLAIRVREDIKKRVGKHRNLLIRILFGQGPPATKVILGLSALLCIGIPLSIVLLRIIGQGSIFGVESSLLILVGFFGALGSIVSIMVRIQDFTHLTEEEPSVLFFTGFFKPIVGLSFALFVFAVLKAGLIPLAIDTGKEIYFYVALSFISGFSERFAKDIETKTEEKIMGQ